MKDVKTKKPQKGRTSITDKVMQKGPPAADVNSIARVDTNRPVNAGAGKHRGDRRDMSPTYTGNAKHASRGSNARKDVKTRAR